MVTPNHSSTRVCPSAAVPVGGVKIVALYGREVALIRREGRYFALENRCPHKDGPLGMGEVKAGIITCPWHRFRFDLMTGESVTNPAMRATVYSVEDRDGELYVQWVSP